MIAKKTAKKPDVPDNYTKLALYVAAAQEKGEKLDRFWISNCNAGEELADLDVAIAEIEATRSLNTRSEDRTYHLVVSFRPGEEEKLSEANLKDIERSFAEALGYGEHQRVVGTHINTDNFHMHVAINKINPETLRCHTPLRDFQTLARVCREMEKRYNLHIDVPEKEKDQQNPLPPHARDREAKTWEQSFEGHLLEHKTEILEVIGKARDWQGVHRGLAGFDAALKPKGAGLVFAQLKGPRTMKASLLDRSCGKKALETRFGPYEQAKGTKSPAPRKPYRARPLTRHPATQQQWSAYKDKRKTEGFLKRNFGIRSWKDYLMAEAHKDGLALAIILAHKEFLHTIDTLLTPEQKRKRFMATVRRPQQQQPFRNGQSHSKAEASALGAFREDAISLEDTLPVSEPRPPKAPSGSGRNAPDLGAFPEDALSLEDALASRKPVPPKTESSPDKPSTTPPKDKGRER